MTATVLKLAYSNLGEDILAVVRAIAKRRALLDHEAEVARIQSLQTRAADQKTT
ncbi:MAG: hypothetical protein Q7V17_13740 [Afipia sp.]|nr:hypothetical protein [Afipia sp.]